MILLSEQERALELLEDQECAIHRRIDRFFAALLIAQFAAGLAVATWLTPLTRLGAAGPPHAHLGAALLVGAAVTVLPVLLAWRRPGRRSTRHVIAAAQMMSGALLIHLTGGRIETHFHIFASLAFLSFYRDWKVLMTASAVVAADHLVRGAFWPLSIYGSAAASPWRGLEHLGWVAFADAFLALSCIEGRRALRVDARQRAHLELTKAGVERVVGERTRTLEAANLSLRAAMDERMKVEEERDRLTLELTSAHKLEAIGQLAAGIAHEINTPVQFVTDNVRFLQDALVDVLPILSRVKDIAADERPVRLDEEVRQLARDIDDADIEMIRMELPSALSESLEGLARIAVIVRAMKDFSHPGSEGKAAADLNKAIESTLTVARNEWKYAAEVVTRLDPALPAVPCMIGEINQVVLNLVINAAHAITERADVREKGTITVTTRRDGGFVEILVADTGAGIPPEARERVFDPFFTTKGVGRGTGQGLALAYNAVVQRHAGELTFDSEVGRGTTFVVRLPLVDSAEPRSAA